MGGGCSSSSSSSSFSPLLVVDVPGVVVVDDGEVFQEFAHPLTAGATTALLGWRCLKKGGTDGGIRQPLVSLRGAEPLGRARE